MGSAVSVGAPHFFYAPMHEVVPRVVAIAVRMVMAKCRIFCQSSFLFIVFCVFGFCFFTTEYTEYHGVFLFSFFVCFFTTEYTEFHGVFLFCCVGACVGEE